VHSKLLSQKIILGVKRSNRTTVFKHSPCPPGLAGFGEGLDEVWFNGLL